MKSRLRKTFLELIAIPEVWPHEKKIVEYVLHRLKEAGANPAKDAFGNVIASVPGKGDAILLSTHLDIPEPMDRMHYVAEGDLIRSDGSGILGADPKSGLAVLIEFAADLVLRDPMDHIPVEIVLTLGEESGLHGAKNLDYGKIRSKSGLVLDEDGPVTQVVIQAPALVSLNATIHGKPVHPSKPDKGVNALQVACRALSMIPWGYTGKDVTWNVGRFRAGTAVNTVPGIAQLEAELRSFETADAIAESVRIESIFHETARELGASCQIERELEFGGYSFDRHHPLLKRIDKIFRDMGLTPNHISTFGASDANVFNANNIACVPIGSGYFNAHQYDEYVDLGAMSEIHEWLMRFVTV